MPIIMQAVEALLGIGTRRRNGGGPVGKLRRVFEEVSRLPRYQQQRIVGVVEDMVNAQQSKSS